MIVCVFFAFVLPFEPASSQTIIPLFGIVATHSIPALSFSVAPKMPKKDDANRPSSMLNLKWPLGDGDQD